MKILTLVLFGLFTSMAHAATYQLPTIYQMTGHVCNPPTFDTDVIGTNSDGTQSGMVYAYTGCSDGRGPDSYAIGCAVVLWDANGKLLSYDIDWRQEGRYVPPSSACFGS